MSIIKFPKWAIKAITLQMAHFFWGNLGDVHKYHLANWGFVSQKKAFGGLGVPNLREFNLALLASWAKRFFMGGDKNWITILNYKYITNKPNLLWSKPNTGSPFWRGVTWALSGVRPFYKWVLGKGTLISFWHDVWAGEMTLKTQFWDTFSICQQQDCSVAQVWDGSTRKLTFRRCVDTDFLSKWQVLLSFLSNFIPNQEEDQHIYMLEPSGSYSVKSFYNMINWGAVRTPVWKSFWKIMAPRRYLVFLWMAYHNKVLTRDNLSKRQVVEDITCLFCAESESVAHLFFYCIVAKEIWTVIAEIFNFAIRCSMSDLAVLWCVDNKKSVVAISCVAVIWSIWTLRNDLCFQGSVWTSTQTLLGRVSAMLHQWKILCVDTQSELLRRRLQLLDRRRGELLRIAW